MIGSRNRRRFQILSFFRRRSPPANSVAAPENCIGNIVHASSGRTPFPPGGGSAAEASASFKVVVVVSVTFAVPPAVNVTVAGEKAQFASAASPAQVNVTGPANPCTDV